MSSIPNTLRKIPGFEGVPIPPRISPNKNNKKPLNNKTRRNNRNNSKDTLISITFADTSSNTTQSANERLETNVSYDDCKVVSKASNGDLIIDLLSTDVTSYTFQIPLPLKENEEPPQSATSIGMKRVSHSYSKILEDNYVKDWFNISYYAKIYRTKATNNNGSQKEKYFYYFLNHPSSGVYFYLDIPTNE